MSGSTNPDPAALGPRQRLILASASPRRQALLRAAGYDFDVIPADVNEDDVPADLSPSDVAIHLACAKAAAVADQNPDAVVLGADTVVAFGEQVIGKPRDIQDAARTLQLLSGTTHIVITGICVLCHESGVDRALRVMSAVHMKELTDREMDDYLATGDWQGKAGAYGIQDKDPFVTRTAGSHSNIVGLPMSATKLLLAEAGVEPENR